MFEFLKRDDRNPLKNSEAVTHEEIHSPEKIKDVPLHGFEQSTEEKEKNAAYELGRIHNAYNNVSIGTDKQGNIILSASALGRENSPMLDNDKKRLQTSRVRKKALMQGDFLTSSRLPKTGAFAFKADKKVPEMRMLRQIKEYSQRYNIEAVNEMMPFMSIDKDIEELQVLRRENGSQSETAALETAITDKKAAMHRFIRTLKAAKRNARKSEEPSFTENVRIPAEERQADDQPADDNKTDPDKKKE